VRKWLALLGLLIVLAVPTPAQAAGMCPHDGRVPCTTWQATVRGEQFSGYVEDFGGTDRAAVEREARIQAAYAYAQAHGQVRTGTYDADGFDAGISVKPAEAAITLAGMR
jgi:hypothetical protein